MDPLNLNQCCSRDNCTFNIKYPASALLESLIKYHHTFSSVFVILPMFFTTCFVKNFHILLKKKIPTLLLFVKFLKENGNMKLCSEFIFHFVTLHLGRCETFWFHNLNWNLSLLCIKIYFKLGHMKWILLVKSSISVNMLRGFMINMRICDTKIYVMKTYSQLHSLGSGYHRI